MTRIHVALLLVCLPLVGHAQMYKCKQADGRTTFQDVECPPGTAGTKILSAVPKTPEVMSIIADSQGHFHAGVMINDVRVDGVIDTGATLVSMSVATARSMGIPVAGSRVGRAQTANGIITTFNRVVPLVRIGGIDLYDVEISITANSPTLIGMNVLRRLKVSEENGQMTLSKQW